jgi:DNA-binding NarL/FixJ family response regulator
MNMKPTPEECSILSLIATGHKYREIGRKLGYSERTIRNKMQVVFDKYGAHNQTKVVMLAMQLGDISLTLRRES